MAKPMMQEARTAAPGRKKNSPAPAKPAVTLRRPGPAFQHYQAAVQLLQQGKYEKALAAFEKLLPDAPPRCKERCQMYIATCQRQMEQRQLTFLTPEEHYDYAISQLNTGYYEEAREQFNNILAGHPAGRLRLLRAGAAGRHHRAHAGLPGQPGPGHRAEPQEPAAGPRGQRLPEHGGRSPLYRTAVS